MTWNHAIRSLLANYLVLLAFAVLLLVACCVLVVLLVRAVHARRTRASVAPGAPLQGTDFPDAEDVFAVLEDAQRILSSSEHILSSTAHDLESSRKSLERLRLESAVRRRGTTVPLGSAGMTQEGDTS